MFDERQGREIDVLGAGGGHQWVCKSKWIKGKRIGPEAVDELLQQADLVYKDMDAITVTRWKRDLPYLFSPLYKLEAACR